MGIVCLKPPTHCGAWMHYHVYFDHPQRHTNTLHKDVWFLRVGALSQQTSDIYLISHLNYLHIITLLEDIKNINKSCARFDNFRYEHSDRDAALRVSVLLLKSLLCALVGPISQQGIQLTVVPRYR